MASSGFIISDLFSNTKPVIACIHLMALPGAPLYEGDMERIYAVAKAELELFKKYRVDGVTLSKTIPPCLSSLVAE